MWNLMLEGGFPMFFLLAFGAGALVAAGRFARLPSARKLRVTIGLAFATGFTTLTATCADLAAVGHHAPAYMRAHPESSLTDVLFQGVAESMSPGILGFTMLALVALMVVLGTAREPVV